MDLFVLRHGIAADRTSPAFTHDQDRPLTSEGQEKMEAISRALKKLGLEFDLLLSSPFVRARQTAEIVARTLDLAKRLRFTDNLAVGSSPRTLLQELIALRPPPKSLLLVGHEPFLSSLVSLLAAGREDLDLVLKKGGLCKLSVERLVAGRCAALEWLLTPRHLIRIGDR